MKRIVAVSVFGLILSANHVAVAGGFEFPDHGVNAMSRGGSAVANTEGTTAVLYNPAGLAELDGLHFVLDGELSFLSTNFQRTGADANGVQQNIGDAVSNERNLWAAPFAAVSYSLIPGLSVGVAGFGPSAFAWRRYPDPRKIQPTAWDGDFTNDPSDYSATTQQAPQRYNLIDSQIIVLYPSLAVGYKPVKWVSVGLTGQLVSGTTAFSQSIYSGFSPGEDPANDAIANLDVKAKLNFTGIAGIQIHPMKGLAIGLSYRPGMTIVSEGTLKINFSDNLVKTARSAGADLVQTKDAAVFTNDFPSMLRAGVAYSGKGWLAELGGTWEGWSRVQDFQVDTSGVEIFMGDMQVDVANLVIPKNWKDSFSLRLGGRFELGKLLGKELPLTLRAGYVHETSAIPSNTLALDFITGARDQITLGASYDFGPITVSLAASRLFQATRTVTESLVLQSVSQPPILPPPPYAGAEVGTGSYDASTTLLFLGVQGHFLGKK